MQLAQAASLARLSTVAAGMALDGELTWLLLKRWVNPASMVTM